MVVRPGSMRPSRSAASIIATPMRSFTEPPGLATSSLPKTRTPSGTMRVNSTIGVPPTCSAMLIGIRPIPAPTLRAPAAGTARRSASAGVE